MLGTKLSVAALLVHSVRGVRALPPSRVRLPGPGSSHAQRTIVSMGGGAHGDVEKYLTEHPVFASLLRSAVEECVTEKVSDPTSTVANRLSKHLRVAQLPPPLECPSTGVEYTTKMNETTEQCCWVFQWNHFINQKFFNKVLLEDVAIEHAPQLNYPARLKPSAGYRREWTLRGGVGRESIGDQTIMNLVRPEDGRGDGVVGALVPLSHKVMARLDQWGLRRETVCFDEHVEWLGWMQPPKGLDEIVVLRPGPIAQSASGPPTYELPILQSHVDDAMEGVLCHGEAFAAEWLDTCHGWSKFWLNDRLESRRPWVHTPLAQTIDKLLEAHPSMDGNFFDWRAHMVEYPLLNPNIPGDGLSPGARRAAAAVATVTSRNDEVLAPTPASPMLAQNFVFGFGSIIQTESRRQSDPGAVDAAPCRIKREFGYVREWNFQASTAQICALGLRKVNLAMERGATINGVVFPAPRDMSAFDLRENGYRRVQVPMEMVEMLSWQKLPPDAKIWIYVPYAPKVVAKFGVAKCSGPHPPDGLDEETEAAGLALSPPSVAYPILQTYVDVCLSGCLEHGEEFAKEFILTTFLWSPCWLNERTLARRPWLHQKFYVQIDRLLADALPQYFERRKLESEYATLLEQ